MATIKKHEEVVQRLPTSYTTGIGRVISRWAYLEWIMYRVTYKALGVNPKQGRIAVRQVRPDEYITMIQNLLKTRSPAVPIPDPDPTLKPRLQKAKATRDYLAHGLWIRHPRTGKVRLWLSKGELPSSIASPDAAPLKIAPRVLLQTPTDLAAICKEIDDLIALAREFEKAILRALASSRGTTL